jgi:hypothetical protein
MEVIGPTVSAFSSRPEPLSHEVGAAGVAAGRGLAGTSFARYEPTGVSVELIAAVEDGRMSAAQAIAALRMAHEAQAAARLRASGVSVRRKSLIEEEEEGMVEGARANPGEPGLDEGVDDWWADVERMSPPAPAANPGILRHAAREPRFDEEERAAPKPRRTRAVEGAAARKRSKTTIDTFKELAAIQGGLCLSREYLGSRSKLFFECGHGHRWLALPGAIRNAGTWCPECAKAARAEGLRKSKRAAPGAAKGGGASAPA